MSVFKFLKNRKSNKSNASLSSEFEEKLCLLKPSDSNTITTAQLQDHISPSVDTPLTSPIGHYTPPHTYEFPSEDTGFPSTLRLHGFEQTKLIRNTSQGAIIEARSTQNPMQKFVIKKVLRTKSEQKRTTFAMLQGGNNITLTKNILKEAALLRNCTVANKPNGQICKFMDFFKDDTYFYLVMTHGGDITLAQWVQQAFSYIDAGKLDIKQYKNIIKYIFWQVSSAIYWLHNDLKICHLGIRMENILVSRCEFIIDQNGNMSIPTNIQVKLCDFSAAQVFRTHDYGFIDAEKVDTWALGILLYQMAFGENPFVSIRNLECDAGFCAIKTDKLDYHIVMKDLSLYTTPSMLILICGLLKYDECKRFDALEIIQCKWFASYWSKYKVRIAKKSFGKIVHFNDKFPYYQM